MDPDSSFIIQQTKNNGKGIFACRNFREGEALFDCTGEVKDSTEVNSGLCDEAHCIQTAKDKYLLSSEADLLYYINHSCDPNAGYKVENGKAFFAALKDIQSGEEITFDYSTSMNEDRWELDCDCGSKNCRGKIRDFKYLPLEIKNRYIQSGSVPEFVFENT